MNKQRLENLGLLILFVAVIFFFYAIFMDLGNSNGNENSVEHEPTKMHTYYAVAFLLTIVGFLMLHYSNKR